MATLYVKVSHHPSGNRTLMISESKLTGYDDVRLPGLFANSDAVMFYRHVANHIAQLSTEGHQIEYTDSSPLS